MECKVGMLMIHDVSVSIGIYPEWNVKYYNICYHISATSLEYIQNGM